MRSSDNQDSGVGSMNPPIEVRAFKFDAPSKDAETIKADGGHRARSPGFS
jgi:hypothetical protein